MEQEQSAELPGVLVDYQRTFLLFLNYVRGIEKINIATLGPKGTSSEMAAKHLLQSFHIDNAKISLLPTYEAAFESVLRNKADLLLVANAYERIDRIYMSQYTQLLFFFVFDTSPYGLAKRPDHVLPKDRRVTIATHHAPSSLVPFFTCGLSSEFELVFVNSTSEAALKAQALEADLCVTNIVAAEMYGIKFISRTHVIRMLWSVFGRL